MSLSPVFIETGSIFFFFLVFFVLMKVSKNSALSDLDPGPLFQQANSYVQPTLDLSNMNTSTYLPTTRNIVFPECLFLSHFNAFYLKLLVSQSKLSRTRKFTMI